MQGLAAPTILPRLQKFWKVPYRPHMQCSVVTFVKSGTSDHAVNLASVISSVTPTPILDLPKKRK
jgi:hypothetical protein